MSLWLRRGTFGYAVPAGIVHKQHMGKADDVRGHCALGWEFLLGDQPLQLELLARHKEYEAIPEFAVGIPDLSI